METAFRNSHSVFGPNGRRSVASLIPARRSSKGMNADLIALTENSESRRAYGRIPRQDAESDARSPGPRGTSGTGRRPYAATGTDAPSADTQR
ncbi:hypothetical protein ACIPRD_03605 [Streptomyces sp. NPDC090108]|uniref:hypothetical protein n=1 Tax=Streptomyces sp. NPDC090108 TaxID=3365947 RepID=UPI003805067C